MCATYYHEYVLFLVVPVSFALNHSCSLGFISAAPDEKIISRRLVPIIQHDLLTFSIFYPILDVVRAVQSLFCPLCSVLPTIVCLFCPFAFDLELSVIFGMTSFDCHFWYLRTFVNTK